jgi:short-subunit dehydrogenase
VLLLAHETTEKRIVATSASGTTFVAGASSGISAIYADRSTRRGYDLILVARNRGRLDGLANGLSDQTRRKSSRRISTTDLGRIESLRRYRQYDGVTIPGISGTARDYPSTG